jgi:hypothetical protein
MAPTVPLIKIQNRPIIPQYREWMNAGGVLTRPLVSSIFIYLFFFNLVCLRKITAFIIVFRQIKIIKKAKIENRFFFKKKKKKKEKKNGGDWTPLFATWEVGGRTSSSLEERSSTSVEERSFSCIFVCVFLFLFLTLVFCDYDISKF